MLDNKVRKWLYWSLFPGLTREREKEAEQGKQLFALLNKFPPDAGEMLWWIRRFGRVERIGCNGNLYSVMTVPISWHVSARVRVRIERD